MILATYKKDYSNYILKLQILVDLQQRHTSLCYHLCHRSKKKLNYTFSLILAGIYFKREEKTIISIASKPKTLSRTPFFFLSTSTF